MIIRFFITAKTASLAVIRELTDLLQIGALAAQIVATQGTFFYLALSFWLGAILGGFSAEDNSTLENSLGKTPEQAFHGFIGFALDFNCHSATPPFKG